jgi:NAD(P)-dependent dehydrogenase (short-subunit alcohol dehydrogenase family)
MRTGQSLVCGDKLTARRTEVLITGPFTTSPNPSMRDLGREPLTNEFETRSVLIIGAATGIGRATAELFAEPGANLVMADVNPTVEHEFQELAGKTGARGFAAVVDVRSLEQCRSLAERMVKELGAIDVLAATTGTIQQAAQVEELPTEEWDRVMDVNLKGHFFITKAVVPYMRQARSGRIVLVASFWGRKAFAYYAAYCASKAGVISLAQALAEEMARYGVTVNSIAPGNINTGMHESALRDEAAKRGLSFEEFRDSEWAKIPLGRAGEPEDIGHAILYLASDAARYVTGASLDVNGGLLLR